MEFKNFEELKRHLSLKRKKCVVVAAAHDKHTLEAVIKAEKDGIITAKLVGNREKIICVAKEECYTFREEQIIDADDEFCATAATALIKAGKGDLLMKGKLNTAELLRPVVDKKTGIGTGRLMSHAAILEIPTYHKLLGFSDGGMIPAPNFEEKVEIMQNMVTFFHELGYDKPKVGILTASEIVNRKIQETVDAAELKKMAEKGVFGDCIAEGPISFDLAVNLEMAVMKDFKSEVAGDADILITPNITAGNGIPKALMNLAGATMAGCVLGAKVPIILTSRGASFEEKYLSLILTAALTAS